MVRNCKTWKTNSEDGDSYAYKVEYEYAVNGTMYQSKRLSFGKGDYLDEQAAGDSRSPVSRGHASPRLLQSAAAGDGGFRTAGAQGQRSYLARGHHSWARPGAKYRSPLL